MIFRLSVIALFVAALLVSCSDGKEEIQKRMEAEKAKLEQEQKAREEAKKKEAEAAKKAQFADDETPPPPMIAAADKADWGKVKELLATTPVETKDARGRTVLYLSASKNNKEVFDMALAKGADIKAKRDDGDSVLLAAARSGNVEMINILIEKGLDPLEKDNFGRTTLMYAAQSGDMGLVKFFLDKKVELNAIDKYNNNALVFAVKADKTEVAKFLLGKGAEVNVKRPLTEEEKKKIEEAKKAALSKAKFKEQVANATEEKREKTVLFYAVENGNLELVKLLVAKGAPVMVTDVLKRKEILMLPNGKEKEREVIEKTVRTAYEKSQKNLLMYAAEGGHLEVMKFLVSKGAKIEETDGDKVRNPLFYLVSQPQGTPEKEKKWAETAEYLVKEGQKEYDHKRRLSKQELLNEKNKAKNKSWFERNENDLQWKIEKRKKIDIEEYDYEGWTVLALATMNNHFGVFKVLMDNGVLVDRKDRKEGKTALMYARAIKNAEMEKMLLEKGAREGVSFDVDEEIRQKKIKELEAKGKLL